ncbi:MAG: ABC transporter ATP-binding protein, partial [Acidimicrobiales bacterium]|nr:ABC transporter ATP-binding protein [Acidimicrobiales bacterium]
IDRIPSEEASGLGLAVAAMAGLHIGRWLLLMPAIVQWHGAYVFWNTLPRVNALTSLVGDPGPVTDRLPGSPGEAVSRFRDDAKDIANVLDVWLDMVAALLASIAGLIVLYLIAPRAALAMVVPIVIVLWIGHVLAQRLRTWRLAEREATAAVTGFIGDTFGAIGTVKLAVAEQAVLARFDSLGRSRAHMARRDQVGTQLSQTLGGITANAGLGLTLFVVAPLMSQGDLTVGDVGLFTTYATLVGGLPRITARWSAYQSQADISAARLGRLTSDRSPDGASAAAPTWLRSGPPAFVPTRHPSPGERDHQTRLRHLKVRGLNVRLDGTEQLHGVDLDVRRGELVVVTGPVGSGKSVLLRSLLGLIPREGGTIHWNDDLVDDPSTVLVPPRAAYVPQVPRLFSEPLADSILLGVDPDALDRALALARLDDDLSDMPDGLATRVGPKGVRLSGGQVQRAAAARALVRRPELLVIDDLSSALDVETEAQLWDGLFEATHGNLAVLAVSHRPRVLERADQVLVLNSGQIVR